MADQQEVNLGRSPTSPRLARIWLPVNLEGLAVDGLLSGTALENIRLMASELVSNVVLHTESQAVLALLLGEHDVTVSVTDTDPKLPRLSEGVPSLVGSGRGLLIVDRLADRWGVDELEPVGKRVWFSVDFDRGPRATHPGGQRAVAR